jgi:hypothetical protein
LPNHWAQLKPAKSQVLICDLQQQIVARSKTTSSNALSQSAAVLCRVAQLFALPIALSMVPEADEKPKLISALEPFATAENQFLRANADPFLDAATRDRVSAGKRRLLILAGFATEVVVLHAALSALRAGYGVVVAADACGGMSERTENAAFDQIRWSGGVISSVVSIATALHPDFTTPEGQQMFQIVQTLRLA